MAAWAARKVRGVNNYYTYIYLDPEKSGKFEYGLYSFEFEPFYVGKGTGDRDKSLSYKNGFVKYKIRKVLRSVGKKPVIVRMIDGVSEQEAINLERKLIKLVGRRDLGLGPLTNLTDGGDGISGYKFTRSQRERMSASHKGEKNSMYGKPFPDHAKKILREKALKRKVSEETKRKMSEGQRRRAPLPREVREKIRQSKLGKKRPFMTGENNPMNNPEVARKVSEKLKGHKVSQETRDKISHTLRMNAARKLFDELVERRQSCV